MIRRLKLPRGAGAFSEVPVASAEWASDQEIAAHQYQPGHIWLGAIPTASTKAWPEIEKLRSQQERIAADTKRDVDLRRAEIAGLQERIDLLGTTALLHIGIDDDRHMITEAGTRSGKGTTAITPNLKRYPGSVVCIDPKGENARNTAAIRSAGKDAGGMGQHAMALDPYDTSGLDASFKCGYNPMDKIKLDDEMAIDIATGIAEALIIRTNSENAHFDESARSLIKAIILYVAVKHEGLASRNLLTVHRLLMRGADLEMARDRNGPPKPDDPHPFDYLLALMRREDAFDGVIAAPAYTLQQMGDRERGGVLSTARRNMEFLEKPPMRRVLSSSGFDLDRIKTDPDGVTIYLCLPTQRMHDCGRWLRLMITMLIERMYEIPEDPATGFPVLMILEEFPVLGHMEIIEQAAGYAAGFSLKLWVIIQDLTQLQRHYADGWETFLGNAGVIQAFANSDVTTLEYLSTKLGECEITRTMKNTTIAHCTSSSDPGAQHQAQNFLHERGELGIIANPLSMLVSPEGSGENTTTTDSWNTQVEHTALMRPDEIERFFAREHLSEIVMIKGTRPMILYRVEGDESI